MASANVAPAPARWSEATARDWYDNQPWLVGCNFIPSTGINQLEMWQADTFDIETIARELGWASALGFNTARVFLHDLLWRQDASGFIGRLDRFLATAGACGIRPMFVLFDGVWDPHPKLGPQRAPRPHVHNSGWVQSPGAEILGDTSRHSELEEYVKGVVGQFAADGRVLAWDLFNEPDNPNGAYSQHEVEKKDELAHALLQKAFEWARAAGPTQPLTVGVWRGRASGSGISAINDLMLAESDVVSFHSYDGPDRVAKRIDELESYHRPLLLTEYLSRPTGSTPGALLPMLKERKVGAFNWGLVAGKTQTQYPWDSWVKRYDGEPEVWFHDIFCADGRAYDESEVAAIRRLTGVD